MPGASDGARTRDLRRDRPDLSFFEQGQFRLFGPERHGNSGSKFEPPHPGPTTAGRRRSEMTDFDQEVGTCPECGMRFGAPKHWWNSRREDRRTFYCPNGHSQSYRESESDKLRQERDRLKQQVAQRDDEIRYQREAREHEERRVAAMKGQVTKLKKRASAGVCPCCTRHFTNLERHMTTEHPDFTKQPDAADNVVKLKTA